MDEHGSSRSDEPQDWVQALAERLRARSQDRGLDDEVTDLVVSAFVLGASVARGATVPELEEWAWVDAWEWSAEQHSWFKRGSESDEDAGDALRDAQI